MTWPPLHETDPVLVALGDLRRRVEEAEREDLERLPPLVLPFWVDCWERTLHGLKTTAVENLIGSLTSALALDYIEAAVGTYRAASAGALIVRIEKLLGRLRARADAT